MSLDLNAFEQQMWEKLYPDCDKYVCRDDVVFFYPSTFKDDADIVVDRLQSSIVYLKDVTVMNPIEKFRKRILVGYSKQATQSNWRRSENRIFLPWERLNKRKQPLHDCSHELVHPFYHVSKLHDKNEPWGDTFCEFMRGPIKNLVGQEGNDWWQEKIDNASNVDDDSLMGKTAGQFILKAKQMYDDMDSSDEEFINKYIDDKETIKKFVNYLYDNFSNRLMISEYKPTEKMIKKYGDRLFVIEED